MGKWSDLARASIESHESGDDRDNKDVSPDIAPIVPKVPIVPPNMPAAVVMGLRKLKAMPMPHITNPKVWPEIVRDADLLASSGWGATALGLGWSPLELWGWSPEREGLAVWLAGRPLVLVDDTMAIVRVGTLRSVFNRWDSIGAKPLWEL